MILLYGSLYVVDYYKVNYDRDLYNSALSRNDVRVCQEFFYNTGYHSKCLKFFVDHYPNDHYYCDVLNFKYKRECNNLSIYTATNASFCDDFVGEDLKTSCWKRFCEKYKHNESCNKLPPTIKENLGSGVAKIDVTPQ